jgi:hypothetical protein
MILSHPYKARHRDRNESWFLRQMCKDLKDYLLSVSLDDGYSAILYHVGGIASGETSEIFAQEFPFLEIICIDDWEQYPNLEFEFDERLKFYANITKLKGKSTDFENEIFTPSMIYIDGCKNEECIKNDLHFWLNHIDYGVVLSGYNLSFKLYKKPKDLPKVKKVILSGIRSKPHKKYLDGSWYFIL